MIEECKLSILSVIIYVLKFLHRVIVSTFHLKYLVGSTR